METGNQPVARRSRRWRIASTITSLALGAAVALTGSGVQPAAASAGARTGEAAAQRAQGAYGARLRAFWPHRFTVTGTLSAVGAAVASVGGSVGTQSGDAVSITLDYADDKQLAEIKADFAGRGLELHRVRRYTVDAFKPQPDGSREEGWSDQWSLFGPNMRSVYNVPYGLDMMNAWKVTKGSGSVVAVLDTGILAGHPDLATTKFVPGYDFVCYGDLTDCLDNDTTDGSDGDPSDPGDWCPDDGGASSWHGTHVTGTIAAQLNRIGIAGIAPDTKILPVRVLGQCGGADVDINAAIRWAAGLPVGAGANGRAVPINKNPADVINLSLGGWGACDTNTAAAIRAARGAGALVVVSAGNSNDDARNYSPAGCADAFTVAALGPTGFPAYYTNVGEGVDIAAPGGDVYYEPASTDAFGPDDPDQMGPINFSNCPYGESRLGWFWGHPSWEGVANVWCKVWTDYYVAGGIVSTISSDPQDFEGNYTYEWYNGTSMAAPAVSAVAALIAAKYPTMSPTKIAQAITESARGLPTRNSVYFQDLGQDNFLEEYVLGYGDVYEAVNGFPAIDAGDEAWTTFFEEYYFGEGDGFMQFAFGCVTTSAVGVMGFEIYGTDPCATDWDGADYWQVFGWAAQNEYNGTVWSDPIYNPYSVSAGDDCSELDCGAGFISANAALIRAKGLSRTR